MTLPKVSIVVTVKNEEKNVPTLLDSLHKLDYSGEFEVIVVDGGSTDKTIEIARAYPFVKLITTKCNVSRGRNIGIKNSDGRIIAFTDGDCVVDRHWIKNIVKHFERDLEIAAVGGPYLPLKSARETLVSQYLVAYQSAYFPTKSEFTTCHRIATGNTAYLKKVLDEVGGFGERLDNCEDDDLNLRLSSLGYKLLFAEDVKVYHEFRSTLKEASTFAFHRGKASAVFNRKHRKYRELLFPYIRTMFIISGTLFMVSVLTDNLIWGAIELVTLFFCYYFYRLIRFRRIKYQLTMSAKTRFVLPLFDLYIRLLESFGSVVGLLKTLIRP